ncbi:MAG: hypothetical protein RLZZ519_1625 [Bacteroidota bacterium]|jgi:hypothetical protein
MRKYIAPSLIALSLLSAFVLSGCKEDPQPPAPEPATFQVDFAVKWGSNDLALEQYYPAPNGRNYNIQMFKCFVSNLSLVRPDDSVFLVDDVALIDMYYPASKRVSGKVKAGTYTGLRFNLGLDSIQNHGDPSDYPVESPLSSVTGMYWSWFTNYIFAKIEGIADSTNADTINPFLFHPGLDSLRQEVEFSGLNIVLAEKETETLTLTIDLQELFFRTADPIDVSFDNFTHTTDDPVLAGRVMRNLKAAIRR